MEKVFILQRFTNEEEIVAIFDSEEKLLNYYQKNLEDDGYDYGYDVWFVNHPELEPIMESL